VGRWALSRAANPAVLRLDTSDELTGETIETCPPATPPPPLDRLMEIPGIRSLDLHRYRARLNLSPDVDPDAIATLVHDHMKDAWGAPSPIGDDPPREFPVASSGPRLVAESGRMAGSEPILRRLFAVDGVAEAILDQGRVQVRLGRLFSWADVEEEVRTTLS
jgi:hypothetical protein